MNTDNLSLESIKETFQNLGGSATECLQDFEERVRSAPLAAVALGVSVGYLFRFVPVGFFLNLLIRLVLFSIKPLILIFGAVKLYELVTQNRGEGWPSGDEREPLLDSPSGPPAS